MPLLRITHQRGAFTAAQKAEPLPEEPLDAPVPEQTLHDRQTSPAQARDARPRSARRATGLTGWVAGCLNKWFGR